MSAEPSAFLDLIRPMREADVGHVARIETAAYDFPWTPGIFRDCLRMGYDCAVHLASDELVGYCILSYGGGEAHILNLGVDPRWHGRGYGRRLLKRALRQAARYGNDAVFLEVRPSNRSAVHLYQTEGFELVGRRRDYYPRADGREDALVMRCTRLPGANGPEQP